jgi:hypothetical protein
MNVPEDSGQRDRDLVKLWGLVGPAISAGFSTSPDELLIADRCRIWR